MRTDLQSTKETLADSEGSVPVQLVDEDHVVAARTFPKHKSEFLDASRTGIARKARRSERTTGPRNQSWAPNSQAVPLFRLDATKDGSVLLGPLFGDLGSKGEASDDSVLCRLLVHCRVDDFGLFLPLVRDVEDVLFGPANTV
jgi:hypothetical protein